LRSTTRLRSRSKLRSSRWGAPGERLASGASCGRFRSICPMRTRPNRSSRTALQFAERFGPLRLVVAKNSSASFPRRKRTHASTPLPAWSGLGRRYRR
jgi:hypothetical protein